MNTALLQRLQAPGPKRILACDGGGIRGLMSVEILAKLEADLRQQLGKPDLVLADFFDFAAGTSTGAIIAACVSAGMSTAQMRRFYVDSGAQMFDKASLLKRLRYSYNSEPLAQLLRRELNRALGHADDAPPATLGDPGLKCLLLMVMRNHSTDSPWFVSNHPLGKYNDPARPDSNLQLPLWQLVRASTAAPTYFPPEVVVFGEGSSREYEFVFVDGGITGYNNPAFLSFEMATAAPYRLGWATGPEQMLIVSVGTGKVPLDRRQDDADDLHLLAHAQTLPLALMNAATEGWDLACRTLGACRHGAEIDRETGAMLQLPGGAPSASAPKLFSYVRYDPLLTREGLDALGLRDVLPAKVQQLDSVAHIADIQRVGQAYAAQQLRLAQLAPFVGAASSVSAPR
jgi:patatin-like phospholipase/acyl hydrolase